MTLPDDLRFGLFLGQGGKDWGAILEGFQMADELGYDYAWLVDHFVDTDGDLEKPCMEAWTLLAGIAALTSRVRLGVLVTGNTYRHPSLLAKEAVTVDHISGGRLILGVGAGWHEPEHRMYGLPFPTSRERVDRFEEAVRMMDMLMSQERTTFEGRYYRLDAAPFQPKPVQRPRIPLLIAAHRPRMLRLAARYADMWDTFPVIPKAATEGLEEDMAERSRAFEGYCREAGRDPRDIRRSTWTGGDALESEEAFLNFVNTYRPLGFTDFTTGLPGPQQMSTVHRIATELIPALKTGTV
jgi:F420-dependent oxidoreductase-like protein